MNDRHQDSKERSEESGFSTPENVGDADDRFLEMLTENQVRLRAYIFIMVRNFADADDIAQQTFLAIWKKRQTFDPSRDFYAWACGVARIEVLLFRRTKATDRLQFDDALLNTLAVEYLEYVESCDRRRGALHHCLTKLSESDRSLLQVRYSGDTPVADIASEIGRPLSTVYRSLARIRESLFNCVQRSLAHELHTG